MTDDTAQNGDADQPAVSASVPLPSGEALTIAEVDDFLQWRPVRFISIVGDQSSGKTTLVCAIYERFLRGEFAGYLFAGSRSLVAFEKRSHLGRVESGLVAPDTIRTTRAEGVIFLHLALAPTADASARTDLMLSDRAGEVYKEARDRTDVASSLVEIRKADTLVILLDGERVADMEKRTGAMHAVRMSLRAFLEGQALDMLSAVQIVTTKVDIIQRSSEQVEINRALIAFEDKTRQEFGGRLGHLSFWKIAARDPTGATAPAFGVGDMLRDWVGRLRVRPRPTEGKPRLETEFDRLIERTKTE